MKLLHALLLLACPLTMSSETFTLNPNACYGPVALPEPFQTDAVNVAGKSYSPAAADIVPEWIDIKSLQSDTRNCGGDSEGIGIFSFGFRNGLFTQPEVTVKGVDNFTLYLDGRKCDTGKLTLRPGTHSLHVRTVGKQPAAGSLTVELSAGNDAQFSPWDGMGRTFGLEDVLHGTAVNSSEVSPDGRYAITSYTATRRGGATERSWVVTDLTDGKVVGRDNRPLSWMPKGSRYKFTRKGIEGEEIVAADAATGTEQTVASGYPEGCDVVFTPDEKTVILLGKQIGKKETDGVYQVRHPEDRQPGWRDKSTVSIFHQPSATVMPLTFGHHSVTLEDISPDSRKLLLSISENRIEKRPSTLFSLVTLDLETMKADTIVNRDGFIGAARFSPEGGKVLVAGSPEALGGIGRNLPEGRIPSMMDNQLFTIDLATGEVKALTRKFNPSVEKAVWAKADGNIWFTAEDRDCVALFRLNPADGKITKIQLPEDYVRGFSLADTGKNAIWWGEGASRPLSRYKLDTKSLRSTLLETPKGTLLEDVALGACRPWDFVNSRGDTICGRFHLPPDFDPAKKYPLIVYYYGGCSPTSRTFESRYPHNAYAAQGYVVYVVQPSGATGFGQEFSSRHVETAGKGVAEDIIEGTKEFCRTHPFVDEKRIGCLGASYGGFMTQYLQTVTDIFAAAVSHAGISDHTSYWGEGWWGYSYSEVAMGDEYPWTDKALYVDQSPLYRADKIHTPVLFLHGDKDNNVPVGESIQMFTALKALGRPTAFVAVEGEDHHIKDYAKRIKWQDTIFAWFARYLKDDPTWWDSMYE